jgi:LPS-assembly protein
MLSLGLGMRPRTFVFITSIALCHLLVKGQVLTNALPPAQRDISSPHNAATLPSGESLPDDPGQEALPVAQPEPQPASGAPVQYKADRQTWQGKVATLYGVEEFHYKDYVLRADKVIYDQASSYLQAEGHVQVSGGPDDIVLTASHGDMQLNMHTARFYDVTGTAGVRRAGRTTVYSTPNPFIFSGRVLLQTGQGTYKIVDGSMTNCRLPKPDWQVLSRSIRLADGHAATSNAYFKFFGIPLFYFPYLSHPTEETGRESGLLLPVIPSNYNSIRGYTSGEQVYWVINRSMDMTIGAEYYSKRGFAPNGDFRYKGAGLDHLTARWNALLDRGVQQFQTSGPQAGSTILVNQGGVDIVAEGRKDLSPETHAAGTVEFLSSYVYRLVFNDNYWQAISSEVKSDVSATHAQNGFVPSLQLSRFQTFASATVGDEARILRLPAFRYDILDRPLGNSPLYWELGSSISHLGRAEPSFHAHNVGRIDFYPHLSLPLHAGGWSFLPEAAVRETFYTGSQTPDLTGTNAGVPTVSHDPLNRSDIEAAVDVRPPAVERDFSIGRWNRQLRHVIEPELTYRFVGGINSQAQNVLTIDTSDIATNTNEVGFSLTQRLYARPLHQRPCAANDDESAEPCPAQTHEWASWQVAQKYFLDPRFGGAIISDRRNVFDSTLDLSAVAFLTSPRNLSPVTSRLRFEAIDNLRIQWDLDYDPRAGRLGADNIYAGYSWGSTTVGVGHALLNAVDELGSSASLIKSQQLQPFLQIGKQTGTGFNLAANLGYDFTQSTLQYGGIQAVYNWDCCGLTVGYRRLDLGSLRGNDAQYLYSFTFASFGSVGDVRHSNSVFRDPTLPPQY